MLEVVFNDSSKASMIIAKKYDENNIDGNSKDVAYIGFNLDMGDISGEIDSIERQQVFNNIRSYRDIDDNETKQFFQMQVDDVEKLLSAAKQGVPIRIWKSNTPFSACGFAFVCDLLRKIDCKISVVQLPEYLVRANNTMVSYTTWSEINPSQVHRFLSYEKELSKIEKIVHANLWQELKTENSPLRAIVNGKLISVPEDFYDHLIVKNIPDGEFTMVHLIGTILAKYPLGVGDSCFALRIKKMIEESKLEVVEDKDTSRPYGKILKKING